MLSRIFCSGEAFSSAQNSEKSLGGLAVPWTLLWEHSLDFLADGERLNAPPQHQTPPQHSALTSALPASGCGPLGLAPLRFSAVKYTLTECPFFFVSPIWQPHLKCLCPCQLQVWCRSNYPFLTTVADSFTDPPPAVPPVVPTTQPPTINYWLV